MKNVLLTGILAMGFTVSFSQLTVPPEGGNKKAMVGERIGITDVTIEYNRPGVKGREGKIWGQLVHTGFADLGFGTSKAAPWRAGANENTVVRFSTGVKVEGKDLPAGQYALFIAYDPNECTVIFSKNYTSWGSFFYDENEDALRVKVKPEVTSQHVEWLKYEFTDQTATGATISLYWEKLRIPIRIETDYVKLQLESFRRELRGERSFNPGWQSFIEAATFCLVNNTNLEEGLKWAEHAISGQFIGEKNFTTLSTKAQILAIMGRTAEAESIMKEALPLGNINQIHQYARQLVQQKKAKEAFEAFKLNYDKHPSEFTTLVGMARGYSALGDYKKAISFAQKAFAVAPDKGNKDSIELMMKKLQEGKDIN
jgi:Putative Zn-dependent protease, contains TPR repeats